jgi:hypothetical protein
VLKRGVQKRDSDRSGQCAAVLGETASMPKFRSAQVSIHRRCAAWRRFGAVEI